LAPVSIKIGGERDVIVNQGEIIDLRLSVTELEKDSDRWMVDISDDSTEDHVNQSVYIDGKHPQVSLTLVPGLGMVVDHIPPEKPVKKTKATS